jgi:hypothetical protein
LSLALEHTTEPHAGPRRTGSGNRKLNDAKRFDPFAIGSAARAS